MENQGKQFPKETRARMKKLVLPISALLLEILPFALLAVSNGGSGILLALLGAPAIGLIMGVSSLRGGKAEIGVGGMIIAAIAVVLPVLWIGCILVFFIGVGTGIISLM